MTLLPEVEFISQKPNIRFHFCAVVIQPGVGIPTTVTMTMMSSATTVDISITALVMVI